MIQVSKKGYEQESKLRQAKLELEIDGLKEDKNIRVQQQHKLVLEIALLEKKLEENQHHMYIANDDTLPM